MRPGLRYRASNIGEVVLGRGPREAPERCGHRGEDEGVEEDCGGM